jgi:hypothetical protein
MYSWQNLDCFGVKVLASFLGWFTLKCLPYRVNILFKPFGLILHRPFYRFGLLRRVPGQTQKQFLRVLRVAHNLVQVLYWTDPHIAALGETAKK